MADDQVWYDLDFHFSSGQRLSVTMLEGRDAIVEEGAALKVTVIDGTLERTVTIHKNKLDAVESTKRIEKKELTREFLLDVNGNLIND